MKEQLERYSNADWLREVVRAIPVVGSALDLAITAQHSKIARERLAYLLKGIEHDLGTIKDEKVDRKFLESEHFHDLIFAAFSSALRRGERDRLRLLSRVLVGSVVDSGDPGAEADVAVNHLDLIASLSPADVRVLRRIVEAQGLEPPSDPDNPLMWALERGWEDLLVDLQSVGVADPDYHLHRLAREGCLKEITGTYFDYSGGVYLLTAACRRLCEWLDRVGGFPSEEDVQAAAPEAEQ